MSELSLNPTLNRQYTGTRHYMIIEIQDKAIIMALLQHVRDNKNTGTNEYPTVTDTVESILYHFLIGSSKKD